VSENHSHAVSSMSLLPAIYCFLFMKHSALSNLIFISPLFYSFLNFSSLDTEIITNNFLTLIISLLHEDPTYFFPDSNDVSGQYHSRMFTADNWPGCYRKTGWGFL
jgi:hypothetical protein